MEEVCEHPTQGYRTAMRGKDATTLFILVEGLFQRGSRDPLSQGDLK